MAGSELTRHEVERIAFDAETPENIAENFQRIIKRADELMNGTDTSMTVDGEPLPSYRILYIVWADGLKLWID